MKKILILAILISSISVKAQTYFVSQIPYNPMPFDSGIEVLNYVDDQYSMPMSIGFDFYFFGQSYNQLLFSTNSYITFDLAGAGSYSQWNISTPIPSNTNPMNSIYFPFQDLLPAVTGTGTMHHQVYGLPPSRKFVMSFDSIPFFSCNNLFYSGQLILYEGSNNIEINIRQKDLCSAWNAGAGILGIQNATGTQAFVASNYNYPTQWTANNESWLFSPDSIYSPQTNQNRISGRVFADLDFDCNYGGTDYPLMNKPVVITDTTSGVTQYMFTDMQGYYSKYVDPGTYSWTTNNVANQNYATNCPVNGSYLYSFAGYNDSTDNNMIADTIVDYCSDLTTSIWVYGEPDSTLWWGNDPLGVCDTGFVQLFVSNNGTMNDNALVTLTLNDSTSILFSPVAFTSLGNNQYSIDLGNLVAGADTSVVIMIKAGCDTIGTPYCFAASVGGGVFDCSLFNNNDNMCVQIGVPFDPNAMLVSSTLHPQDGIVDYLQTQINDDFTYTIHFQNTGSAVAHDVRIETIIDSHLTINSITPGASSASYNWLVIGNKLILQFTGIELADSNSNEPASHGFVRFKIEQANGNIYGTVIPQMANIYFDYLSPVATNNAVVELHQEIIGGTSSINNQNATIYPNPAHESFNINCHESTNYIVQDLAGRIIEAGNVIKPTELNCATWAKGIYFITLQTTENRQIIKLVKD